MPIPVAGDQLPPKDKKTLQEEDRDELRQAGATIEYYDHELKRRTNELRQARQHIGDLQHETQRSKDFIRDLQATTTPGHRSEDEQRALEIIDLLQHESQRSKHFVNDLQNLINVHQHLGATEDASARRLQDAQATTPGHHSEDEQQGRTLEIKQSTQQVPVPPPPKDIFQQLREEFYRIRDEYRQSRVMNDNYDRELKRRNGELQKANHHINHLQIESQLSKDTITGLQNEVTNVHQQLEDAKALSEVRGKELIGFLSKADTLSILDVGDRVNALNEEIFQAAATLGEALIHARYYLSRTALDAAVAVSKEMVGETMTNILIAQARIPEPEVNPLLVQVVLQIVIVEFCVSKVKSWYPSDSDIAEFLSVLYSEIHSTEEQAVSGRWRALTRSRTRPSTEKWKDELYQKLQPILMVASWSPRPSENEESYGNRLPLIFRAINELRTAMGENFSSADLEIFVCERDEIYDPGNMEDAYGDGGQYSGKRAPEPIVGTTGIGLGKNMAERKAKDDILIQVLILPKIVLWSTLNEALEPIKSSKKKKQVGNTDGANQDGRD